MKRIIAELEKDTIIIMRYDPIQRRTLYDKQRIKMFIEREFELMEHRSTVTHSNGTIKCCKTCAHKQKTDYPEPEHTFTLFCKMYHEYIDSDCCCSSWVKEKKESD